MSQTNESSSSQSPSMQTPQTSDQEPSKISTPSQAWYIPTSQTLFPLKKADYKPRATPQSTTVASKSVHIEVSRGSERLEGAELNDSMDSGTVEQDAVRFEKTGMLEDGRSRGDYPPLRTRRSLEVQVMEIEDAEVRRLTAVAYLA